MSRDLGMNVDREGDGPPSNEMPWEARIGSHPTKKTKKSETSEKPKEPRPSKRKKKSLSLLPALPLDVLYEIFSCLPPKDILNLTRTNRLFRDTLGSPHARTVWMMSMKHDNPPPCPANLTPPFWANILYGSRCQECGAGNIQNVDFSIMLRICRICKKSELLSVTKMKRRSIDVEQSVLELVPSTYDVHRSGSGTRKHYWAGDISQIQKAINQHEENIRSAIPNAQQAFEDFKAQQNHRIREYSEVAPACEDWKKEIVRRRASDVTDVVAQRVEAISGRFMELGYTAEDVYHLRFDKACTRQTPLTDRIWNRIRGTLEPSIRARRDKRLDIEFRTMLPQRLRILESFYDSYKRSLRPADWRYLPRILGLSLLPEFAKHIYAVDTSLQSLTEKMPELFDEMATILDSRNEVLRSDLNIAIESGEESDISDDGGAISDSEKLERLNLATSVFRCPYCGRFVFGWEDASKHCCRSGVPSKQELITIRPFTFHSGASKLAGALVDATDLSPEDATVSEVDHLDLYFNCPMCDPRYKTLPSGQSTRLYSCFTWRSLITHVRNYHRLEGPFKNYFEFGTVNLETLEGKEERSPRLHHNLYSCNHCLAHLNNLLPHEECLTHLRTEHNIDHPKEPSDMFFMDKANIHSSLYECSYYVVEEEK